MIAYHGTSSVNASSIQREGFRPGTWFAFAKENASGPVIFGVEFSDDVCYWHGVSDGWQFWIRDWIGPKAIKSLEAEK